MRETAFFYLTKIQFQFPDYGSHLHLTEVGYTDASVPVHYGYLLVIQIYHPVGILHNRGCIGADQELVLADTKHQRASLTGGNKDIGIVLVYNYYRISTYHIPESQRHSFHKRDMVRVHHILHQLYDHLGVRLTVEMITLVHQFHLKGLVILYDAVMNQCQVLMFRIMRMRIDLIGLSVSSPTGMRYTYGSGSILVANQFFQIAYLSF